jgi:hypothetical protein
LLDRPGEPEQALLDEYGYIGRQSRPKLSSPRPRGRCVARRDRGSGVALPGVVDIIDWRAGPHRRDRDLRNLIAQVIF